MGGMPGLRRHLKLSFGEGIEMRCYLIRDGQIQGIEFLKDGPDEKLIEQAKAILQVRSQEGFEGIELWSGNRFIYRTPRPDVADQKRPGR
jgi:hypothetical protein